MGGGIIGLCVAHYLERGGAEVVLVERGRIGSGCSWRNGGWVCPSISRPLPAPGLTLASLRWMLRSDSPLYIRPSAMPRLAGWLWAFHRHCNATSYARGVAALAALNEPTDRLYRGLVDEGVTFEREEAGTILAYDNEKELQGTAALLDRLGEERVGPVEVLDREALAEMEPDLQGDLLGLRVPGDTHVRPEALCTGLGVSLAERGVELVTGAEIVGFAREGSHIRAALAAASPDDSVKADVFVLAAGAETNALLATLGRKLPVQAGKGYSITIRNPRARLSQPLHVTPARVGFTPFEGALRVLGTMEFSGINQRLDRRRIAILERAARRYLPGALDGSERTDWVGMRPVTPDGLPAIGWLPGLPNVCVATGHQMLGVTLAPSTGLAVAQLVLDGASEIDLVPFDPGRFH